MDYCNDSKEEKARHEKKKTDTKHGLYGIAAGAISLGIGSVLTNLTADIRRYSTDIRGHVSSDYGLPFVWKHVEGSVTESSKLTENYQPWNLLNNGIFWTAATGTAIFALTEGYNIAKLIQIKRKIKKLEKNSK